MIVWTSDPSEFEIGGESFGRHDLTGTDTEASKKSPLSSAKCWGHLGLLRRCFVHSGQPDGAKHANFHNHGWILRRLWH